LILISKVQLITKIKSYCYFSTKKINQFWTNAAHAGHGPRAKSPMMGKPARVGIFHKNTLELPAIQLEVRNTIPTNYTYANKPFPLLSFTMVRSFGHPRARRRDGDGIGWPRRPARTHAGSTNGPTPIYNPSAYTSLGYRSGGARGSGDHGACPCTTVARPCRPPKATVG